MANYTEKLKDPRWQKKRLKIMDRDDWTCQSCGDKETNLNIHHKKYNGAPWEAKDDDLITICSHCHFLISKLDLKASFDSDTDFDAKFHVVNGVKCIVLKFNNAIAVASFISNDSMGITYVEKEHIKWMAKIIK